MSAAQEDVAACLSEQTWQQLLVLEARHRESLRDHEAALRVLDQAAQAVDRAELLAAWNQYRTVVAALNRVAEDIGALRLV